MFFVSKGNPNRKGMMLFFSFFTLLIVGLLFVLSSTKSTRILTSQGFSIDSSQAFFDARSGLERGRYYLHKFGSQSFPLSFSENRNGKILNLEVDYQNPFLLATATFNGNVTFLMASVTLNLITPVAATDSLSLISEGDYLAFGGNEWIMLDKNTRMVISKTSVGSRVFHGTKLQSWDVLGTPQANKADLNTWLNGVYLNSIDPFDQFIQRNSTFSIEAGNGTGSSVAYNWNGAIGLLTLTQFNALNVGGPTLNGTAQKAIEPYNTDQNMSDKWWLLTPFASNDEKVEEVNGGGTGNSTADSTNEVRPLLYLKSGLNAPTGDGSEGSPWNITP